MLFFTADTHFGETRGIAIDRRPYKTVKDQDAAFIANWNAVVGPGDTIYHLGDFGRGPVETVEARLAQLNGEKHLIIGNNDPDTTQAARGWASVAHYRELWVVQTGDDWDLLGAGALDTDTPKKLLILCHYAFRSWNQMGKGSINLHGHSHGRLKPITRQYDVGVDAQNFSPVTLARLLARKRRTG